MNVSRCEVFGVFDNGLCDNHRSLEGWRRCLHRESENSRCEVFGVFDNGLCDNHRSLEGWRRCLLRESENSRCEVFGVFDNGLCDNHSGCKQCTFVVDPTFKFFTANSRCRKFGTFEKGRCEDHDGIIQCPINGAHTASALSLFGQEELTHGAFYEFECPSTECRKSGNVVYRFCGICSRFIISEDFLKACVHPCAKDILYCDARNGRNGTWCRSILTTVDGQELTDGALLKCDSP